jgi:hypothetical protein
MAARMPIGTPARATLQPVDHSGNGNCSPLLDRKKCVPKRSGSVAAGRSSVSTRYQANSWMISGTLRSTST